MDAYRHLLFTDRAIPLLQFSNVDSLLSELLMIMFLSSSGTKDCISLLPPFYLNAFSSGLPFSSPLPPLIYPTSKVDSLTGLPCKFNLTISYFFSHLSYSHTSRPFVMKSCAFGLDVRRVWLFVSRESGYGKRILGWWQFWWLLSEHFLLLRLLFGLSQNKSFCYSLYFSYYSTFLTCLLFDR